jgi:hypothetical protein
MYSHFMSFNFPSSQHEMFCWTLKPYLLVLQANGLVVYFLRIIIPFFLALFTLKSLNVIVQFLYNFLTVLKFIHSLLLTAIFPTNMILKVLI